MIEQTPFEFIAQVTPPDEPRGPSYWFAFQEDRMLVRAVDARLEVPVATDPAELGLTPIRQQYLGYVQEQGSGRRIACYSAEIDPAAVLCDGLTAEGLRALYPHFGDALFNLAGRAVQIVAWERTHRFCGQCGAATELLPNERARRCPACGLTSYPRISPAIIIAVVRQDEHGPRLLLARNHRFPPGRYSVIAGFVEPGESLEDCAMREVCEEVGIRIKNIRYFGSQPWPFPNSLMVGFTAEYADGDIRLEESEIAEAGWFAADALPQIPPRMSISRRLIDWFTEL